MSPLVSLCAASNPSFARNTVRDIIMSACDRDHRARRVTLHYNALRNRTSSKSNYGFARRRRRRRRRRRAARRIAVGCSTLSGARRGGYGEKLEWIIGRSSYIIVVEYCAPPYGPVREVEREARDGKREEHSLSMGTVSCEWMRKDRKARNPLRARYRVRVCVFVCKT